MTSVAEQVNLLRLRCCAVCSHVYQFVRVDQKYCTSKCGSRAKHVAKVKSGWRARYRRQRYAENREAEVARKAAYNNRRKLADPDAFRHRENTRNREKAAARALSLMLLPTQQLPEVTQ